MADSIYIETTIPSLYVARASGYLVEAARQQLTRRWWDDFRHEFEAVCSQTVLDECGRGDAAMAEKRLGLLSGLPLLDLTEDVTRAAEALLEAEIVPRNAADDAIHIAVASVHKVDYLLTWNCRHLANPRILRRVSTCLDHLGFQASLICTPEEMMGDEY